ncbi:MAG: hypothetical protein LBE62_13095 [Azonexus sp.]|jgi:prophage tail gpP-like protein|nr:hypothetical protein [Azonexus sp.]
MDEVLAQLRFDGQRFDYWQKVDIRESVDDLCASVQLGLTRRGDSAALGLTANTVADLLIDEQLVTTVRADSVSRQVDAESCSISITARSLGRELVDCQYSKTLSGLPLAEIVQRLCGEFNVPVTIAAETELVPDFSMQCETPANAILNAARAGGLLIYPLPDGGLILTRPTEAGPVTTLRYGETIKSYTVVDEYKLRFSDYVIKGYEYAGDAAQSGRSRDKGIGFFRPLHIVADRHGQGLGGCERRAEQERARRQARSHRIELEIPGWRYPDADGRLRLWAINTQVRIVIPDEGINDVFLIGERSFRQDDRGGSLTALQVMPREAFLAARREAT